MLHAAGQVEVYSISGSQEEQGDNVDNESKIKLLCGVWDEPVLICFRRMPPETKQVKDFILKFQYEVASKCL